jgi:ABC-type lipoprotein export system ATPase subunit
VSAVVLQDLFRVYSTPEGDAAALQGLTLAVREGEIVVALGPSGSGKTTMLRLLAGLDRPSAGSIRVFEQELSRLGPWQLGSYRAETLGYVDQHYARALPPELTVREIAGLQLGLLGVGTKERDRRALELLDRVGLDDRASARPHELSGGEQQRVALCAAVAHRPRHLLADEPTGELDTANADAVYDLLGELARETGSTTVIVSHDPSSARIADRAVSIRDGRVSEEAGAAGVGNDSIVVGRGGWLRLPEELLARAGIRSHAVARFDRGAVVVSAAVDEERLAAAAPAGPRSLAVAASAAAPVAAVRGLAKSFAGENVFDGLDATFAAGRLHAVTGPSGSGKTTLLRLLAGLDIPSRGSVRVLETELSSLGREERATFRRRHVALVAQESPLVPFLSARENVELSIALREPPRSDDPEEALAAVGLAERVGQRVLRLSAGEQTRVQVARAVAGRPELLLADEPTARLDQANALAVVNLLAALARETGTAIVCATHDPIVIEHADAQLALAGRSAIPPRRRRAASGGASEL